MTDPRGTLLLVDDDRQTRLKLTRSLEAQGHKVTAVDGGRPALETLATTSFDVVLLDLLMPGVDGFEVLETLKGNAQLCDVPVIVISALDDAQTEEKCRRLGAHSCLAKPVDAAVLNARIAECLDQTQ